MANLISLFGYQQKQEGFLPYVLFQTYQPQALQCLSPDIMQLTDSIYVADLSIVEDYWQKASKRRGKAVCDLLEEVITKNLPDCALSLFCEHPFQGLVFFNHLKQQNSRGHFKTNSLFSQKIYQNMNWYPWFLAARQVHDCMEKHGCLKKERQNFNSQLGKMSRFVERVDIQEFSGLQQAHFFEVSRRFKGFLGLLWKWTFPSQDFEPEKKQKPQLSLVTFSHYQQLLGFPWVPYFEQESPRISNLLEYPLSEWEAIKDHLLYDLEKLSNQQSLRPPFKALQMQWSLTLFDMSVVEQNLHFKTPLCFTEDREEDFGILIKQLQFAFDQFQQKLSDKAKELEVVNTALIVGWSLEVSKRLILSERTDVLDPEERKLQWQKEDLLSLTNKVKSGLKSFKIFENFIPGFDFSEKELLEESPTQQEILLNLPRPFYLYPEEKPLQESDIKSFQFLDRTSSDWWNRQDALDSYRDCFLCELKNKEFVFAYRNYQGKWYSYGV